jgi:hypothetical protein
MISALALAISFLFVFAVVFQFIKVKSFLFLILLIIFSPLLALTVYHAVTGVLSFSFNWLSLMILVVVVAALIRNRLS